MYQIATKERERILVVDDEPNMRAALAGLLEDNYGVDAVGSGEEALLSMSEELYNLVILDINLPAMDGMEVLKRVREHSPDVAVVIMTGHASIDSAITALQHGATHYLQKPASGDEILNSVKKGLEHSRRERKRSAMLLKAKKFFETGLEYLEGIAPEAGQLPDDLIEAMEIDDEITQEYDDPDRFLKTGPLLIDSYRREAKLHGELLDLTAGEYDLLLCLARNAPKVLDPRAIVEETRGFECTLHEARDLIRWQVYLLRQKIEEDPSSPEFIVNVRGKGYMWATT
jgi:DNA-binding response OmpR family regulator